MPTNLNALIRYKQIDTCLRNRHRRWTIDDLRDACSEALGEHRGRYQRVAESTIRDDIRVMRSDILGYNAPIEVEGGYYTYSEPEYSIFNVSITDMDLLRRIFRLLLEEKNTIKNNGLSSVLLELAMLTGEELPGEEDLGRKDEKAFDSDIHFMMPETKSRIVKKLIREEDKEEKLPPPETLYLAESDTDYLIGWRRILELLSAE